MESKSQTLKRRALLFSVISWRAQITMCMAENQIPMLAWESLAATEYWDSQDQAALISLIPQKEKRSPVFQVIPSDSLASPKVPLIYPLCQLRIKRYGNYHEFYPTKRHKNPMIIPIMSMSHST